MSLPGLSQVESDARRALTRADYERFLPIVRRIAMRAARRVPRHIAVADLVSSGWLGLLEAFQRADATMDRDEFEAYASYRIRGAMLDYLRSMDTVSRHTRRASRDLTRTIKDLTRRLGRPPEEPEIAQALNLDPAAYRATLTRIAEAGMTRLELLDFDQVEADPGGRLVDDEVSQRELVGAVADAVETLPPRLQQVLALYYQEECSLREIGAILGVSESRVSQLHTEAVHRLRAAIGGE